MLILIDQFFKNSINCTPCAVYVIAYYQNVSWHRKVWKTLKYRNKIKHFLQNQKKKKKTIKPLYPFKTFNISIFFISKLCQFQTNAFSTFNSYPIFHETFNIHKSKPSKNRNNIYICIKKIYLILKAFQKH